MAESFECPKCGAPLSYNAQEHNYAETMTCPYCSNSIIVPPQLRVRPARPSPRVEVIDLRPSSRETFSANPAYRSTPPAVSEVGRSGGRAIAGCVMILLLFVAVFAAGSILFMSQTNNAIMRVFQQQVPSLVPSFPTPQPTATDMASSIQTQLAPMIAEVTNAVGKLNQPLLEETATPEPTSTPEIDLTATAAADFEANKAAQSAILAEQRNWPVVLDEKFINANRNWNIGQSNGKLSVEDLMITKNQYIWQITSKKSMGSFSFPDMDTLTDVLVSVDLQMTNNTGNLSDQAGIIFRQDGGAFYFFGANPQGTYSLRLYDGSGWSQLTPLTGIELGSSKQLVHLEVSMQGSQIILAINNEVVNWADDTSLSTGIAGLGVNLPAPGEDATVIFSNFKVQAP